MQIGIWANYFSKRDYFDLQLGRGVLKSRGGARVMTFPREFAVGLFAGLAEECGDAWPVVLHKCGHFWGTRHMQRTMAELADFYATPMNELPTAVAHAAIAESFAVAGWGRLEFDLSALEAGVMLARLDNSPFVDAAKTSGLELGDKAVDGIVAGALGAMLSVAAQAELGAREIACVARGDARCAFAVTTEARLEKVGPLIRKRCSVDEIVRSLTGS